MRKIEIQNNQVTKYGFKNWSDFTQKMKCVVLAMIQLNQDYVSNKSIITRYEQVSMLYEKYKNIQLKCACCGEQHIEFLTIDHINNDGAKHKKCLNVPKFGTGMHQHLFRNGFESKDYQILCFNCNNSLGNRGYCPHHPEIKRSVFIKDFTEYNNKDSMFNF